MSDTVPHPAEHPSAAAMIAVELRRAFCLALHRTGASPKHTAELIDSTAAIIADHIAKVEARAQAAEHTAAVLQEAVEPAFEVTSASGDPDPEKRSAVLKFEFRGPLSLVRVNALQDAIRAAAALTTLQNPSDSAAPAEGGGA